MGVKKLWPTLEPAGQPVRLSDLRGFRVAVDLPHWICELSQVTTAQGEKLTAMKPHIRSEPRQRCFFGRRWGLIGMMQGIHSWQFPLDSTVENHSLTRHKTLYLSDQNKEDGSL